MVSVNFMGVEVAAIVNPKKGRDVKCRKNHSDHPRKTSPGENKCMNAWPCMDV